MRLLIFALVLAISYAQTERRNLAERRSAVRRRLYEHKGIDSDAAAKMAGANGETVDLVIVHDDLELGDNAKERCHDLAVEFCKSIGAHDDVHAVNCEPHEIAKDFTYVGPDMIQEDSTYYCGQYVYDVHPDELDTIEAILDKIDGSDAKLKVSQNHHNYSLMQTSTCTDGNSDLWHLKAMNPSGMDNFRSNQGFDGEGTIAYIIDTGVNKDHVDFEGRVVGGWNIVDNNDDFSDIDGHGTHVAGSVAGRTTGVAPNALIWGVQVFYFPSPGEGPYTGDSYVGEALEKIVEKVTANGEKAVVNMSLGGRGQNTAYTQIIDAAIAAGVNIVVAAGNSDDDACGYSPAFVPSAVTVGAYGQNGNGDYEWAYFSNYGACVDISAPGMSITGPQHDDINGFIQLQGTSMAAPHVAGVIATIMSRTGVSDPERVKWMLLGGEYSADLSSIVQGIPSGTTPLFAMQPCIEQGEGEVPTGPPEDFPVVTTTTATPIVTDFFTLEGGSDCTVNGNCVTSANWPSPHGNDEACAITVDIDSSVSVNSNFEIERNYDFLRVNNEAKWTAEEIPSSLSAGSTISWSTDGSVTKTGWELCFGESDGSNPGTAPPDNTNTPAPTDMDTTEVPTDHVDTSDVPTQQPTEGSDGGDDGAVFSVSGSGCTVSGACVSSKNYPSVYGNQESCTLTMTQNVRLSVQSPFEIELNYDYLTVNGAAKWTAEEIPSTLSSSSTIAWSTDYSVAKQGWKICFSADDGSDNGDNGGDNSGTRSCDAVSSSVRSNDWQPWCMVSSGPLSAGTIISFSMLWNDQGYGNQKGRVALVEDIDAEDPLRHFQTDVAPHSRAAYSGSHTLDQDVDNLEFRFRVGGGGGHRITINDFSYTVTEPDNGDGSILDVHPEYEYICQYYYENDDCTGEILGRIQKRYGGCYAYGENDQGAGKYYDFSVGGLCHHSDCTECETTTIVTPDMFVGGENEICRNQVIIGIGNDPAPSWNFAGGPCYQSEVMTEAEGIKMKKDKALKMHRMKEHQLEEQIRLDAEIAARPYNMVQEVVGNPLLIEVFAFIGAISIVAAVVQKGLQYRNKGDYINIEQEI